MTEDEITEDEKTEDEMNKLILAFLKNGVQHMPHMDSLVVRVQQYP